MSEEAENLRLRIEERKMQLKKKDDMGMSADDQERLMANLKNAYELNMETLDSALMMERRRQ